MASRRCAPLAFAALVLCAAPAAHAERLLLGLGNVGMWHHSPGSGTAAVLNVDYRTRWSLPYASPLIGALVTSDADVYVRAGLYHDFALGARWTLTPHFSVGGYHHGAGQDLGAGLEFQTGVDLTYDLGTYRVGLAGLHISNNGWGSRNPGTEAVMVVVGLPFPR